MADKLYGLTARTAGELRRLIADGGKTGGRASAGAEGRGVSWVKVTGAAVSGWHPGVVSLDQAGAWEDLTTAVKVAAADGSTLATGRRYLCTRTGDLADVARFRTQGGAPAVEPTTLNGDPATKYTFYATENPDATTPAIQYVVAEDVDGAGTPGVVQYVFANGTGSAATSTFTYTAAGVTIAGAVAFTGAVSGAGGGGTLVASVVGASNVASISLTGITGYKWYKVVGYDLQAKQAGGSDLRFRTSSNNGTSYDSGASDYATGLGNAAQASLGTISDDTAASHTASFELRLNNPGATSLYKVIHGMVTSYSGAALTSTDRSAVRASTGAINALQFF